MSRAISVSAGRIDVEHRLGLGLVAGLGVVAGEEEQVVHAAARPRPSGRLAARCGCGRGRSSCRIGSIPFCASRMAAAIGALMCARALAPSVTLTASASPFSGSALRSRSAGSNDTGGAISAVMTKRPPRRDCSSPEAGAGARSVRSCRLVWGARGCAGAGCWRLYRIGAAAKRRANGRQSLPGQRQGAAGKSTGVRRNGVRPARR